jgi:hypothetical protein
MPDIFISYSSKDKPLAEQLEKDLRQHELQPFLAELNIEPGAKWKDSIVEALRQSRWLFFLATPESCCSIPVMHELGGAIFLRKKLVALMWGVSAGQLPQWIQDGQAIDLKERDKITSFVQKIAAKVKSDKFVAGLVAGGLLLFGAWLLLKSK